MRLIEKVPHEHYKISVYSWNNKYIIKIEEGILEQTYKVSEWDILSPEHLRELINSLCCDLQGLFQSMRTKLNEALN